MADFEKSIPIILKHEGGFVNNSADPGGATNRGITFRLFKLYAAALGLPATVDGLKTMTEEQAKVIYKKQFWQVMNGDLIADQQLANIVFDGFVNMGGRAVKMLRQIAGLKYEGTLDQSAVTVINQQNGKILFEGYKDARIKFYNDLATKKPTLKVFLRGWLNRINEFEYT